MTPQQRRGHNNPSLRASSALPYIAASRSRPQTRLAELLQRGLRLAGAAISQGRAVRSTGRPLWLGQREAVAVAGPAASGSGEGAAARGVLGPRGWSRGGTSPGPDRVFHLSRGAGRAGSLRGPLPGPGRAGGTRGSGRAGPFLLRPSPPPCPCRSAGPAGAASARPALLSLRAGSAGARVRPARARRPPEPRPGRGAAPSAAGPARCGRGQPGLSGAEAIS